MRTVGCESLTHRFAILAKAEVGNFGRCDDNSTVMCKETDYSVVTKGTFFNKDPNIAA